MKSFICGFASVLIVLTSLCQAGPNPAVVQGPGLWTVDVKFERPQQIMLRSPENNDLQRYWYVILTVTNNTNAEVGFYPKCELMTDTFQVVPACKTVPERAFALMKSRHESLYPFLESTEQAGDRILCGSDNAKDIAVIWPDFDEKASNIKFFITGLSNETVIVEHPTAKNEDGQPLKIFLRKTLELTYDLKGDQSFRSEITPVFKAKNWVMR